jgi:hypothetical protein
MRKPVASGQREIDQLIEDVTVDCYNDDEERSAFVVAFGEHLEGRSTAATIVGFTTELIGVDDGGERRGLVAHLRHSRRVHTAALYDIVLSADADPELAFLLEAYREWCQR